ncbi:hypothetical protein J437_LFUL010541 [Ladona fulva]|uniref:Uncharacterized protein n=1 Tax=Ladona fulva TaxID=123851 RepID=A0A8K0K6J7_LADFU|nr:hypothetical protein J437_LFUL010541 [Ladona fulva]
MEYRYCRTQRIFPTVQESLESRSLNTNDLPPPPIRNALSTEVGTTPKQDREYVTVLFFWFLYEVVVSSLAFPGKVKEDRHVPKVRYGYIGFVDIIPVNDPYAENEVDAVRENGQIFTESRVWPSAVGDVAIEDLHREKRELIKDEMLQGR